MRIRSIIASAFIALILFAPVVPAWATSAPSTVQVCAVSPSGTSTTQTVTCTSAPTAGNAFIVGVHLHTTAAVTITTPSGTWTNIGTCTGNGATLALYSHAITSSDASANSFAWSWGATAYYSHIDMQEVQGASASAVDAYGCEAIATGASPQTVVSASVTPVQASGDLPLFFSASSNSAAVPTAGTSSGSSSGSCTMTANGASGGIYLSVEYCPPTAGTSATTVTETYPTAESSGYETALILVAPVTRTLIGLGSAHAGGPHLSVVQNLSGNPGTHVPTVVYGWGYSGVSTNVSIATQAKWVTYAYQGSYNSQYQSAGIKTITYSNWWLCYPTDTPRTCYYELAPVSACQSNAAGGANWPAYSASNCTGTYNSQLGKNCSGGYIYDSNPSYGGGYLNAPYINATNFAAIAHDRTGNVSTDYVFSDDTATTDGQQPCNYNGTWNLTQWVTQSKNAMAAVTTAQVGAPIFVNLLNAYASGATPQSLAPVAQASTIVGAMCENCFVKSGGTYDTAADWINDEDGIMLVQGYGKIGWVYSSLSAVGTTSSDAQRIYAYASFLLTYDGNQSMFQEAITGTTSAFPVMPETELVPTGAISTATNNDVGTYSSGGGYFRAWSQCYYNGSAIGGCAVAINPNASGNMTVPTAGYAHAMAMPTGATDTDIVDGGVVSLTGTLSSTLAPQTAEILLP